MVKACKRPESFENVQVHQNRIQYNLIYLEVRLEEFKNRLENFEFRLDSFETRARHIEACMDLIQDSLVQQQKQFGELVKNLEALECQLQAQK